MKIYLSNEKLNLNEIRFVVIYIIISLLILICCNSNVGIEFKKILIIMYSFISQYLLVSFGYKSIRKLNFFLLSICIGLIHLGVYISNSNKTEYNFVNGSAFIGMKLTLFTIAFYYLLRVISLKIQNKELDCPTSSGIELLGYNRTTFVDGLLYFILYAAIMFFLFGN
jgi:hypothetical protein